MDPETFDIVIIGGGWAGITHAQVHLSIHPESNLLILDRYPSLGGTWSKERLYPGLQTNNTLGSIGFVDYPLTHANGYDVHENTHISGSIISQYLHDYCTLHALHRRFRFNHLVLQATRLDDAKGWDLTIEFPLDTTPHSNKYDKQTSVIRARKLVVATGLTSEPNMPNFEGEEEFGAPLMHMKDVGRFLEKTKGVGGVEKVVVYGGSKSASDVAYAYASEGVKVEWVIRESGRGPHWFSPSRVTPLKLIVETVVTTRLMTYFSPYLWASSPWRTFLHSTLLGRLLTRLFWYILGTDIITANSYNSHPELRKLIPWSSPFWSATGLGVLNYPTSLLSLIRNGKISIHIADITRLSAEGTIHFSYTNPKSTSPLTMTMKTDALICATGWKPTPSIKFVSSSGEDIAPLLGLPHRTSTPPSSNPLIAAADTKILTRFPMLTYPPNLGHPLRLSVKNPTSIPTSPTSYYVPLTLYRTLLPPHLLSDRTLIFQNYILSINMDVINHVQSLWATAYFDGKLKGLKGNTSRKVEEEAVLAARFDRLREGFREGEAGKQRPGVIFDSLPYVDLLLEDLGLEGRRKKWWWAELSEGYGSGDYRGVLEEFKMKYA